jgi:ADP-ribose pyrophosphatase YjhB (NUDIX family)
MSSPKTARLVPQPDGTQPDEMMHISSFALIMRGTKVLLVKRSKPERWAGKWCLPAAIINYGEDPAAGVMRVVLEQLGSTANVAKLLDVQSYGDKHWDICFLYEVEVFGPSKLGQDFEKAAYFDLDKLPPEVRDDHREVLEMAKSRNVVGEGLNSD